MKKILRGHQREQTTRFIAFRSHWGFESEFCTPAEGHEKGGVGGEGGYFRRNHMVPVPSVASWEELDALLLRSSKETGRIAGFEALLRWQHPTRGFLAPLEFIPIAEETGMIREVGWWNLEHACRQISNWNKCRNDEPPLTMSVNVSVKQFSQPNLVTDIEKLLREIGLRPDILKLEITESTVMADPAAAVKLLSKIKSLGVQLSIDDFGTGYSSLSYLHRFPLDTLKIDRSFISTVLQEGDANQIVRTILPMAENLQLNVVAEGVETAEQLATLRKLSCGYAQGYYFSEPISTEQAEALLATHPKW